MPLYLLPQRTGSFTLVSEGNSFILQPHRDGNFVLGQPNTGATGDKGEKGDTGVVEAALPLIYNEEARSLSIQSGFYLTVSDAADIYQPISGMGAYLTTANAALTYYPLSNPTGFITSSALTPYLLSSTAASTYYPLTNPTGYITASALTGYATESWVTSQGYLTTASLAGYATESWVTSQGYITSAALSPYLLSSTAASTYYPLTNPTGFITASALTPYLLSTTAESTYYPLTNPSGYITSAALSGYATESWVTGLGYITSSALTPYLTISSAAATYQPISGMSAYYLASNPAGYITSADLSGYATESWVTSNFAPAGWNPFDQSLNTTNQPVFSGIYLQNFAVGTKVISASNGSIAIIDPINPPMQRVELSHNGLNLQAAGTGITFPDLTVQTTAATTPDLTPYAQKAVTNTFTASQVISVADNTNAALRVTQTGTGEAFRVEDSTSPDSTPFVITNDGRVGIGRQPTAGYLLDVAGNIVVAGSQHSLLLASSGIQITQAGGSASTFTITNNGTGNSFVVNDESGDTTPFVINAAGNVGIGVSNPSFALQVGGSFYASQSSYELSLNSSAGVTIGTPVGGTANALTITNRGNSASFRVNDDASDTTPFIVDAGGNVGVKTATPAYDLDINGTANLTTLRFTDGTLQTTAWTGSYNPFDQSLNTADQVVFSQVIGGTQPVGFAPTGGILNTSGLSLAGAGTSITFADGTVQTTAATGNAFDQDLNTFDAVQFSELNITTAGSPAVGVFITADGTITVNDDGGGTDGGLYLNGANVCISFNNTDYQYKAYPFAGAIATAIEGGLLNANSPSSTNAFATLGDVESSVNAYAASVTPVLPTTDEKAALSNANLPSASNPYLTLSGTPAASETQSGIVELANKSEVLTPTSTTLAVSPAQAVTLATRLGLKRANINLQGGMSTQVTGTGATFNQIAQYINFSPPNGTIAGFARGYTIVNTADPTHIASNNAWINFSKPEGFSIGIYLSNATSAAGTRLMGIWGETNSPTAGVAIGDPTNKRILFSHTAGGNILLMVHDGTNLYSVDSGMTPPTAGTRKYYIEVTWDGTGYAEMYVKDSNGLESTVSTNNAPIGSPQSLQHSTFLLQSSTTGAHTTNSNHSPTHPSFFFG